MSDDLRDAAIAYAAAGLAVHPLHPGGKQPATRHGLHDATTDLEQVEQWWADQPDANIGIATGRASGIVVIDVDDPDALDVFEATYGELPPTLVALTGRGEHWIYAAGDHAIRNSAGRLSAGIDVRGDGGYIVAPPSVHPSGGTYKWRNAHKRIAELPDWLADLLTGPAEVGQRRPASGAAAEPDGSPWGRRVLEGELARLMGAVEGQRNSTLFHAACKVSEAVKGGHIPEGEAWHRLEQAARIVGLDGSEARATLESAWRRTPPRHPDPANAPASVDTPTGDPADTGLLTMDDLLRMKPPEWLIPERVPEGLSVLFGPAKSGKTFVALDWALALASRGDQPVVYAAGEGAFGLRRRVEAWQHAHPEHDPSANLQVLALGAFPRLLEPASAERMHSTLASLDPAPKLLVIDTWARAMSGGDEISGKDVSRAIGELDKARELTGTSVLVLHHVAHPPDGRPPERPRGHGAMDGAADAMWRVDPPSGDRRWHRLVCTAMKESGQPPPQQFSLTPSVDALVPTPSAVDLLDRRGDR